MDAIHFSSKTDEHYTPDRVLDAVIACLGEIDLDPCSNANHNVPAKKHYTKADDGLSQPWYGRVFVNPPYGKKTAQHIKPWVAKLVREYRAGNVTEAIALIPSRTDTQWYRMFRDYPRIMVDGRLTFKGNDNPAGFPSGLVYLGPNVLTFALAFAEFGDLYQRVSIHDLSDAVAEEEETADLVAKPTKPRKKVGRSWVELKTINGCGPYAYKRWREGGRHRSEYIGKVQS
jgi:phage N-6-adenine-methyltransferase